MWKKDKKKVKEKLFKEYNPNKWSLIKSSIFVILTLLVTILPFYILPSNVAYADVLKKYKYTFNLGTDPDGVNYTYTIITQERKTGDGGTTGPYSKTNKCDVWIIDSYWNNQPELDSAEEVGGELGEKSLYDYLSAVVWQHEFDSHNPIISGSTTMMKKLLYAALDAGYEFTVDDSTDDSQVDVRYVYDKNENSYGWGTYRTGTVFKNYYTYLEAINDPINHKGHHVIGVRGHREFADSVSIFGPSMAASGSKFSSAFEDDNWICWMITKAIENKTRSGIASVKKEISTGLKEDTNGQYRYEVLEDTINIEKGTVDIDVFRTGFDGKEKKIFTFRYTKGAKTGKQTPNVVYPVFNEKAHSDDHMSTGYYIFWYGATYSAEVGRLQTWPEIEGGSTVNGMDKRFRTVIDASTAYFNTPNCILESLPDAQNGERMLTAPFVFDETNYVIIGYCASHCDGEADDPSDNVTLKQELGKNENPSAIAKIYIGLKIPHSTLDRLFPGEVDDPVGDQIDDGNWHLTRYKDNDYDVVAWNEPASDDEQQEYLIMKFGKGKFYKLYYDYLTNGTYARTGLFLSCRKKDEFWNQKKYSYDWQKNTSSFAAFYEYANKPDTEFKNQWAPFLVASGKQDAKQSDLPSMSIGDIEKAMIKDIAVTEGYRVYLMFYDSKASSNSNRGKDSGDKIDIDALLKKSNGSPVCFDVTEWLREEYEEELPEARDEETKDNLEGKTVWGGYLTLEELEGEQLDFFKMVMRYSRPIIMFLILITIVYTAIFAIMHNQDAGKRALVKERLKHITIGIILFAAVVGILFLCKSLMDTSFEKIEETAGATIMSPFDIPEPEYEENWFLDLIIDLIQAIAGIVEWMINTIMKSIVGTGTDLNSLIFNSNVAEDMMTLSPFTAEEWNRYMYGYRALEALALALLAIAIIKFAADLIINASDSEKTAQAKQTCLRVGVAMLAIVLGPYVVRLLLTIFNYLIKLIPIRDVNLDDLHFADTGIIGAVASLMFVWMKFKIYLVFVVRKLMITFMLLVTPVVFGLWAISEKFRSMSLWIGELFTNTATQFCYALVFFTASLIMYDNQSDFVTLILILMFMKLADFFKDSLQGLVQKWGGIDETKVAEGAISSTRSVLNKGIGAAKKVSNSAGGMLIGGAKLVDKDNVSDGGRWARNAGALLQGNIWGLQGKNTTYENRANLLQKNADKEQDKLLKTDKNMDTWAKQNNIQDLRRRKLAGEVLSPEEQKQLDFADHYLGVRSGNVSLEESKQLAELNPEDKNYRMAHEANVARSNRDVYQTASDNASSKITGKGVDLDQWKTRNDEEQKSVSSQVAEDFNRTRDKLAEKTADLKATNMFDGEKDQAKMLEQATALMQDASKFNEDTRNAKVNNGINLDSIKDTISETLSHCKAFEGSDSYSKLSEFCNTKDNVNNFGGEGSAVSTDAFEKKVNARIDTLKKSGVIK